MRPVRLEIQGIHSFVSNQIIDFEKLLQGGIFGIFGDNGSGKSTILDCICLALYGKIFRSKNSKDFVNLNCNTARVDLEFSFVENQRKKIFEVERIFKRKKNSEIEQSAQIYEVFKTGKQQLCEGKNKVDAFIVDLLQMGFLEFSKCIALPQGEFAGFLSSMPSEKVNIIGNLFDLAKFGKPLYDKAKAKYMLEEVEVNNIKNKFGLISVVDDNLLANKKSQIQLCNEKISILNNSLKSLYEKEKDVTDILNLQEQKDFVYKNIEEYKTREPEISIEREKLNKWNSFLDNIELFTTKKELENGINNIKDSLNINRDKSAKLNSVIVEKRTSTLISCSNLDEEINKNFIRINEIINHESELIKQKSFQKDLEEQENLLKDKLKDLNKLKIKHQEETEKLNTLTSNNSKIKNTITFEQNKLDMLNAQKNVANVLNEIEDLKLIIKNQNTISDIVDKNAESLRQDVINLNKQKKEVDDKIVVIDSKILLNNENGVSFDDKRLRLIEDYYKFKETKTLVEMFESEKNRLQIEIEERLINIKEFKAKIESLTILVNHKKDTINSYRQQLKDNSIEREEVLGENFLSNIVNFVNIGDNCPVCRSTIVQKNNLEKSDISAFDKKQIEIENNISESESELQNTIMKITSYMAICDEANSQIKLNITKIKDFDKKIERTIAQVVNITDNYLKDFETNFNKINQLYDNVNKLYKLQIDLQIKQKDIELNIISKGAMIDAYGEIRDKFIEMNSFVEKISAEKTLLISNFESKYLDTNNFANEYKETKTKLDELNREYDNNYNQINDCQNNILEFEKKISNIETDCKLIQNNINNLLINISNIEEELKYLIGVDHTLLEAKFNTEKEIERCKKEKMDLEESLKFFENDIFKLQTTINSESEMLKFKNDSLSEINKKLQEVSNALGFENVKQFEENLVEKKQLIEIQEKINVFDKNYHYFLKEKKLIDEKLLDRSAVVSDKERIVNDIDKKQLEKENETETLGRLKSDFDVMIQNYEKTKELRKDLEIAEKKKSTAYELMNLVKGNALLDFVAEEYLDDISYLATGKLVVLLDGRYDLRYENKEFFVLDNFYGGERRLVSTLSGGELFIVSLALALSISEVIIKESERSMDFFFLDEGFGTLGESLCESIINSLIKLEEQNLSIGLISHREAIKEAVKNKLLVERSKESGNSVISYRLDI